MKFNPFSVSSVPLEMKYNDTTLGQGTAFFYKKIDAIYLITNWHNLSGTNPQTGKSICDHGGLPNKISFPVYSCQDLDKYKLHEVDIYLEECRKPLWKEHKEYGKNVDIAVIKIDVPVNFITYPINEISQRKNIRPQVASDVYILGFPQKKFTSIIPIWKRASIASEYDMSVDNLPQFLVDTATYKGMSGSPVILHTTQFIEDDTGDSISSVDFQTKFLGIYSGRYYADENKEVGLGRVWKASLIDEILDEGVEGNRTL